jgi:hypothetical protein
MVFDKFKSKADTLINDRVVAPTRTAVAMSLVAVILAGIALIVAVNRASN